MWPSPSISGAHTYNTPRVCTLVPFIIVNVLQALELENKIILNPVSVNGSFEER